MKADASSLIVIPWQRRPPHLFTTRGTVSASCMSTAVSKSSSETVVPCSALLRSALRNWASCAVVFLWRAKCCGRGQMRNGFPGGLRIVHAHRETTRVPRRPPVPKPWPNLLQAVNQAFDDILACVLHRQFLHLLVHIGWNEDILEGRHLRPAASLPGVADACTSAIHPSVVSAAPYGCRTCVVGLCQRRARLMSVPDIVWASDPRNSMSDAYLISSRITSAEG